jgi:hypothetical protein
MWRRVPCEQPLHTGQSILSPRRNPMLMVAGCFDMPKSDAGDSVPTLVSRTKRTLSGDDSFLWRSTYQERRAMQRTAWSPASWPDAPCSPLSEVRSPAREDAGRL